MEPEKHQRQIIKKVARKITGSYLHNAGLYYLQRFAASSAHFRTIMMRKIDRSCADHPDQDREQCADMLDELITKFQTLELLNDTVYARSMVASLRRRGFSTQAIKVRLQNKGLKHEHTKQALQEHDGDNQDDIDLHAALRLARRKRIGPFMSVDIQNKNDDPKRYERALAALARAGFNYETSRNIMEMDTEEAAQLIEVRDW